MEHYKVKNICELAIGGHKVYNKQRNIFGEMQTIQY